MMAMDTAAARPLRSGQSGAGEVEEHLQRRLDARRAIRARSGRESPCRIVIRPSRPSRNGRRQRPRGNEEAMKFDIQPTPNPTSDKDRTAKLTDPVLAVSSPTIHVDAVRYNQPKNWHDRAGQIPRQFPARSGGGPCCTTAQEIFEGLKAYKRDDGGVNLFLPRRQCPRKRFHNSADRMAIAQVPGAGVHLRRSRATGADRPRLDPGRRGQSLFAAVHGCEQRSSSASNRRRNTSSR